MSRRLWVFCTLAVFVATCWIPVMEIKNHGVPIFLVVLFFPFFLCKLFMLQDLPWSLLPFILIAGYIVAGWLLQCVIVMIRKQAVVPSGTSAQPTDAPVFSESAPSASSEKP